MTARTHIHINLKGNWLIPLALLALAGVAALPAAAPLLLPRHPLAGLMIRGFFARVCHQNPARSWSIAGSPMAVCVRCLGVYWGFVLGACTAWWHRKPATGLLAVALLLNILDVIAETLSWHGNLPDLRFALGLFLGVAAGALLEMRGQTRFRAQARDKPRGLH